MKDVQEVLDENNKMCERRKGSFDTLEEEVEVPTQENGFMVLFLRSRQVNLLRNISSLLSLSLALSLCGIFVSLCRCSLKQQHLHARLHLLTPENGGTESTDGCC